MSRDHRSVLVLLAGIASRIVLWVLVATGLVAQRTWVVDWVQRPGTDFTDIQSAVDAAAEGDTIRIRATGPFGDPTYHVYPAPIIDGKGISIIGEGSLTVVSGNLTIRNTQPWQSVTLSRLQRGPHTFFEFGAMTYVQACAGPVLLRDLDVFLRISITNCRLVVASTCQIKQSSGFMVTDSTFMVDRITTEYNGIELAGWPPITGVRSRVWVSNSTLRAQSCWLQAWDVGILLENSDLWVGPNTTVIGGTRCFGGATAIDDGWRSSTNTCSNYTIPPSRIRIDPTAQLLGGLPSCPNITVGPQSAVWSTRSGSTLTVEQRGTPLSVTVLALGPFDPVSIPGLLTPLTVDLDQSLLCMSSLPLGGALQWPFAIPPSLPPGFVIGIQAGTISPTGELSLSNASVFSIR